MAIIAVDLISSVSTVVNVITYPGECDAVALSAVILVVLTWII